MIDIVSTQLVDKLFENLIIIDLYYLFGNSKFWYFVPCMVFFGCFQTSECYKAR